MEVPRGHTAFSQPEGGYPGKVGTDLDNQIHACSHPQGTSHLRVCLFHGIEGGLSW